MAHPDDEVLWACSVLQAAVRIVIVFGPMESVPTLTAGRKEAMAAFPLPTLDWFEMPESAVFDSASWPNPRETAYGLYPHRLLRRLGDFDSARYRGQFVSLQARLRERLAGARNVIVHSPWGEYGHEDHVQAFRAVAGLAAEMQFQVWVPGYYAEKSEVLMRRNLRYFGAPTEPMWIDGALATEISQIYKRTNTWTWFDNYVWPETERFFRHFPKGAPLDQVATEAQLNRIVFPPAADPIRWSLRGRLRIRKREAILSFLSWINGRNAG
jgi:LmbE family N-acetylglucosaminyl deacetylase